VEARVLLPLIQRWMGHARLKTTAIYLQLGGAEERRFAQQLWRADALPDGSQLGEQLRQALHPPGPWFALPFDSLNLSRFDHLAASL